MKTLTKISGSWKYLLLNVFVFWMLLKDEVEGFEVCESGANAGDYFYEHLKDLMTSNEFGCDRTGVDNSGLAGTIPGCVFKAAAALQKDISTFEIAYNSQLTGTLPTEIGYFDSITRFYMTFNGFSGPLPTELFKFDTLTFLNIHDNKFNGSLPSNVGNLKNLETLLFSEKHSSGTLPSDIGMLTKLVSLYLTNSSFHGQLPSQLYNFKQLTSLELDFNSFNGTLSSEIGRLTSLKWLFIRGNQMTGTFPTEIALLSNLQRLYIKPNNFTGTMPYFDTAQVTLTDTFPGEVFPKFSEPETNISQTVTEPEGKKEFYENKLAFISAAAVAGLFFLLFVAEFLLLLKAKKERKGHENVTKVDV